MLIPFLVKCQISSPNDLVTSNTAPAHPHATGVAVYPALFTKYEETRKREKNPQKRRKMTGRKKHRYNIEKVSENAEKDGRYTKHADFETN